ncbi:MAG: capsular biosynthesis protein [Acidobacteria bacterium]|nr:capsular biosynthesis protein [Acidobacteriota bacterium]
MRISALFLSAAGLFAQLSEEFATPRAGCCLPMAAQRFTEQLQDWNQLGRYHAENEKLKAQPAPAGRVVFYGDSITDGWKLDQSFPGKPYLNRGISGQTTPQMLVRFFPDVINLKPAAFVLLAGTNDIARNTGPATLTQITQNIQAMAELAKVHGIRVVLCAVLPVSDYTERKQTAGRPPADILKLNEWLRAYAARTGAVYVDYHKALADEKGLLMDGTSRDGLHPNQKGYEIMARLVEEGIRAALR